MSALAGPDLDGEESLRDVLRRARETFGMESVALKARPGGAATSGSTSSTSAGRPPARRRRFASTSRSAPGCGCVGRGPALFAEDQRVLDAFAAAARTAYEGQVLSGEAEQARDAGDVDEQRTSLLAAVGHDLRTPLAGIKAAVSTLRQTDVEWSERGARRAARDDRGLGRSARRRRRQPARCQPPAGRGAERAARGGGARRGRRRRSARPARREGAGSTVDVAEDLPLVRRGPRPASARARQRARQLASPRRRATARSRSSLTPGAETREAGGHRPWPGRRRRAQGAAVRAVPAPRRPRAARESDSASSVARGFVEAMDGAMVADNTPGRRPDDADPPAARRSPAPASPKRHDAGPGRRGRARPAPGPGDQPAGARLRGLAGRGRPLGADRRLAASARRRRSSTSACPTWTASR